MTFGVDDIGDLTGKVFVVTGANSGLGLVTTRRLAARHGHVVMACRSLDKANRARDEVLRQEPLASVEVMPLDLASLDSIARFEEAFAHERIDGLCNNAGVMAIPRRETADGFEMQLGTNHLGHFALTARLWPRLVETAGARVVNVSSLMHRVGRMHFDDLMGERRYDKWAAYGQSKLSNLLFTFELRRRAEAAGAPVIVAAAHPGYAATNLQQVGPEMSGNPFMKRLMAVANRLVAQDAEGGALPQLRALVGDGVVSGDYFGPSRFEIVGPPKRVSCSRRARDEDAARRLWEASLELTGVDYPGLD